MPDRKEGPKLGRWDKDPVSVCPASCGVTWNPTHDPEHSEGPWIALFKTRRPGNNDDPEFLPSKASG